MIPFPDDEAHSARLEPDDASALRPWRTVIEDAARSDAPGGTGPTQPAAPEHPPAAASLHTQAPPSRMQPGDDTPLASFTDVGQALEQRSRSWGLMARRLEQHRHHLELVEAEQDASYQQLARLAPVVQGTYVSLKTALRPQNRGNNAADLGEIAAVNSRALEELERLVTTLATQALWYRSAWESYSRTVEEAERLQAEAGR